MFFDPRRKSKTSINSKIDWIWTNNRVVETLNCIFMPACVAQAVCDNSFIVWIMMSINTKIDWLWTNSRVIDPLIFTQNCRFLQACVAQVASCLIDFCDNSFKISTKRKIKMLKYKILQQSYNINLNKYSIIKFFYSLSIVHRESQSWKCVLQESSWTLLEYMYTTGIWLWLPGLHNVAGIKLKK